MRNVKAFLAGVLASVAVGALAQIGGRVAELNATTVYASDVQTATLSATGLVKFHLPGSYANDTAACAAGLIAGNAYYTTGTPNVLNIVASCP